MNHRALARSATAVAALVLAVSACGGAQEPAPTAASDGGGTSEPAVESAEPTDEAATDDPAPSDSDEDSSTDAAQDVAAGTLSIDLDGENTELTPEIVRCNGEPDTIRNVVITMREDLPVIKVTPGEFAMVKLHEQGAPEKSSSTKDITAEDGTVTFDNASIGDAVVNGTVTCLQNDE